MKRGLITRWLSTELNCLSLIGIEEEKEYGFEYFFKQVINFVSMVKHVEITKKGITW
jgi:hypothetical protein